MKIGIGLPATIPGTSPNITLEWAALADGGPFSSLGIIDRVAYGNYEPLITLAAAAAVTQRITLMTTILVAPVRSGGMIAKQAATIQTLSGGRLSLGLGVGGREDDFKATGASFADRGRRFEEQLETMRRVWAGESLGDGIGLCGPQLSGIGAPEVLIGGMTPKAIERAGKYADGFISVPLPPEMVRQQYDVAEAAWKEAGRSGRPRLVGALYFGLGDNAAARGSAYLLDYYAFMGDDAKMLAAAAPFTSEAVAGAIDAYAEVGMDELILWPTIPELEQVELLTELIG